MFNIQRWPFLVVMIAVMFFGWRVAQAEHPTEHPSEHPTSEAKMEDAEKVSEEKKPAVVTKEELAEAITAYVGEDAALKGGYFLVFDPVSNRPLALTLAKVHKERLSRVGHAVYFACADFRTHDGKKVYDLDVFMRGPDKSHLTVTEISVHKENGVERYGWAEERGVWRKIPMREKGRGK